MVLNNSESLWNGQPLYRGRCCCGMAMTSPHLDQVGQWLGNHGRSGADHAGSIEELGA